MKNDSSDNSETLEPPVSSLQALSPIPYRYEDDVVIPEGVCFIFFFSVVVVVCLSMFDMCVCVLESAIDFRLKVEVIV